MMTLEEAIKHCKDVALSCTNKECALEHFQLLKWLQEYSNMLEKQGKRDMILLDKVVKFLDEQLINDLDEATGEPFINFQNYGTCKETFISYFKRKMLEKQGKQKETLCEQKPTNHEGDKDNPYDMSFEEAQNYITKRDFDICRTDDYAVFIDSRYILQTIGNVLRWADNNPKQKLIYNIEPKFKVGDYIKHNKANIICKIISVNSGSYYVENIETSGRIELFNAEQNFHLWTIQDAKEGDVLVNWNNTAFIFKAIEDGTVKFHIAYNEKWDAITTPSTKLSHLGLPEPQFEFRPATKEQRDQLEKAMVDAGYKWNKKERKLEKIEQKHTPKHKVGDTVYYDSFGRLVSFVIANIVEDGTDNPMYEDKEGNAIFEKDIIEQKPAWSEEDKKMFVNIKACLRNANKDYSREVDWLKSIKPQPKNEWSEEDDYNLQCMIAKVTSDIQKGNVGRNNELIDWLESLKERVQPQNTRKPSDEHYELEEFAKIIRGNLTGISKAVQELFEAKYIQLTGNKMYMYKGFKY